MTKIGCIFNYFGVYYTSLSADGENMVKHYFTRRKND